MTDIEPQEDLPPVAHVTMIYTGPVAPHWDLRVRYGDQKLVDDFWARVNARLLLLPKHDPQFRRNRERVNRDAERERITCDWDLGEDDADTSITPVAEPMVEAVEPGAEDTLDSVVADAPEAEVATAEVATAELADVSTGGGVVATDEEQSTDVPEAESADAQL